MRQLAKHDRRTMRDVGNLPTEAVERDIERRRRIATRRRRTRSQRAAAYRACLRRRRRRRRRRSARCCRIVYRAKKLASDDQHNLFDLVVRLYLNPDATMRSTTHKHVQCDRDWQERLAMTCTKRNTLCHIVDLYCHANYFRNDSRYRRALFLTMMTTIEHRERNVA